MNSFLTFFIIVLELFPFTGGLSDSLGRIQKSEITAKTSTENKNIPLKLKIFSPLPYKNTAFYEYTPDTNSIMVQDVSTAKILFTKNEQTSTQIASLTKLMTAKILLDKGVLSEKIKIKSTDLARVRKNDATMGLSVGDEVTYEILLKAVLIESASDAAVTIANNLLEGGYDSFISKMNQEAKNLGLIGTMYENPVGWDSPKNYSTPKDLTLLSRILLGYPDFKKIISTQSDLVFTSSGKRFELKNTNLLLDGHSVFGIKTGTTNQASECLITLAKVSGNDVLITVLGSSDRYKETKSILSWLKIVYNW